MPALTATTRTLGAHSTASDRVSCNRPAFAALYTAVPGEGRIAEMLEMLMMTPPSVCSCITAFAFWEK